jgi:hypothetical protein
MVLMIVFWLICWILPILVILCIWNIDKDKDETLTQYIVNNNIEIFALMSLIPGLGIACMLILITFFVIN